MYIRLRALRREHGLQQKELGEIIGVTQSVISRMENSLAEVDDYQYERLVKKYGEEEVAKFMGESPLKNVVGAPRRRIPATIPEELTLREMVVLQNESIKQLIETNYLQQKTIAAQAELIARLKGQQDS